MLKPVAVVLLALAVVGTLTAQAEPDEVDGFKGMLCSDFSFNGSTINVCAAVNQSGAPNIGAIEGYGRVNSGNCDQFKKVEAKLWRDEPSGPDTLLLVSTYNTVYISCTFVPYSEWSTVWYHRGDCLVKPYHASATFKIKNNGVWSGLLGKSSATVNLATC